MDNVKRTEKKHSSYLGKGWKRVITVMLAILMTFFVIDYPGINKVQAEDYAASVTDAEGNIVNFDSVSAAITDAQAKPNSTVTLLQDKSEYGAEVTSGTFTIDLNGKTFQTDWSNPTLYVRGNAKITVKDSFGGGYLSKGVNGANYSVLLYETGSVSLEGGKYDCVKNMITRNVGDMLAEGYAYQDSNTQAWVSNSNQILLEDVTVKAIPVKFTKQPEVTTLFKDSATSKTLSVEVQTVPETSGATFNYQWYRNGTAIDNADHSDYTIPLDLAGGSYEFYCAVTYDNYTLNSQKAIVYVVSSAGQFTVTDAEGDPNNLMSIEMAIDDAKSKQGSTLTLLTDATTDSTVNISSGSFTIDLNGKTWSSNATEQYGSALVVSGSADITLKDSHAQGKITSQAYRTLRVEGGLLKIESGIYENTNTSGGYTVSTKSLSAVCLQIKGGTFLCGSGVAASLSGSSALLSGGTFDNIGVDAGSATRFLDNGYAFQNADKTWTEVAPFKNVTVKQTPIKINDQPQDVALNYGDTTQHTLSVVAERPAGVTAPIIYQWYKNGTAMTTEQGASCTIPSDLSAGEYSYHCVVTCDNYTLTTRTAKVTVAKVVPTLECTLIPNSLKYQDDVLIRVKVTGLGTEEPTGQICFNTLPMATALQYFPLQQGEGYSYCEVTAENLTAGSHSMQIVYQPANDDISKNYKLCYILADLNVAKIDQSGFSVDTISGKKYKDSIELSTTGGSGDGAVSYSVPEGNNVLFIDDNNTAHCIGLGTVTVTATKAGDYNHNAITATYDITVEKADTTIGFHPSYPDAFTYTGTALNNPAASDLSLTVAEYSDVTFTWYKDSILPENELGYVPTDIGTYILVANIQGTDNFNSSSASKTIIIEPVLESLYGHSLSLSGNIGINFYMDLDPSVITNYPNAYMLFTLPDGSTRQVNLSEATQKVINEKTYYCFTCKVNSKQMSTAVTAQMNFNASKKGNLYTYSVNGYVQEISASQDAEVLKAKNLIDTMSAYGAYSETYFDGKNLSATADMQAKTTTVTVDTLSQYSAAKNGSQEGLTYIGSSLLLESETSIRHYFQLEAGHEISEFTFTLGGATVLVPVKKGDYYYVQISDISADNLDTSYTVSVGGFSIQYSALSYAYTAVTNSSAAATPQLQDLLKVLYLYNQEADNYKNN